MPPVGRQSARVADRGVDRWRPASAALGERLCARLLPARKVGLKPRVGLAVVVMARGEGDRLDQPSAQT
jgi:hypothetical protein